MREELEADDLCEEPELREEPDEPELLDALDKPEPPRKPVGVLDDLWEELSWASECLADETDETDGLEEPDDLCEEKPEEEREESENEGFSPKNPVSLWDITKYLVHLNRIKIQLFIRYIKINIEILTKIQHIII